MPPPTASIIQLDVSYDAILLRVRLDRGPAMAFCRALLWVDRPTETRPASPSQEYMSRSPFNATVLQVAGGVVLLELAPLLPGSYYDVYCYGEELATHLGMSSDSIRTTRADTQTKGPSSSSAGWHCVAGHTCSVENLSGEGLTAADRILAREDWCPGRCRCNGQDDPDHKGAECSDVSQDRGVPIAGGVADLADPLGAWCYVEAGACSDGRYSGTFPSRVISYVACTFNSTVGVDGSGPQGFPHGGVAGPFSTAGDAFGWGSRPVIAAGAAYNVCWCNGTESGCTTELDFRLSIGLLHFAGPTAVQAASTATCTAGLPCSLGYFDGYGTADGSRLLALPEDPVLGCGWQPASPADPPGVTGLLNATLPATGNGRNYTWGLDPLMVTGGRFLLCWCGPEAPTTITVPGASWRLPGIAVSDSCPPSRPLGGGSFLVPAGRLVVVGPEPQPLHSCGVGAPCTLADIGGEGLRGGDRVAILDKCGEASSVPPYWAAEADTGPPGWPAESWVNGGWLQYGPPLSDWNLATLPAPGAARAVTTNRGVWGFLNGAVSLADPRPGYYSWGAVNWALSGEYSLCWCGALSQCKTPADFMSPIGMLRIWGPDVRAFASQTRRCVRGWRCEVAALSGEMSAARGSAARGQLFVASGRCGSAAPAGMPRGGESLALAGGMYSWGSEPLTAPPGRYRLCWCPDPVGCSSAKEYIGFAGLLQVKAPMTGDLHIFCSLNVQCNVTGIHGQGLEDSDSVMALTSCGNGAGDSSVRTWDSGSSFTLPVQSKAGRYRLCWCPGGVLCTRGADFAVDLGLVEVGGPDQSTLYACFQFEKCVVANLSGVMLADGDGLMAVTSADGYGCAAAGGPTGAVGFPRSGVALPAVDRGRTYSWGEGVVSAEPGVYQLCWCSSRELGGPCTDAGPFRAAGGALRLGSIREFQYLTEKQSSGLMSTDSTHLYILAAVLPVLFFMGLVAGWRRLSARHTAVDPEAPPMFQARQSFEAVAQQKAKHLHMFKQVLDTRVRASARHDRADADAEADPALGGPSDLPHKVSAAQGTRQSSYGGPESPRAAAAARGRRTTVKTVARAASKTQMPNPPPLPGAADFTLTQNPRFLELLDA